MKSPNLGIICLRCDSSPQGSHRVSLTWDSDVTHCFMKSSSLLPLSYEIGCSPKTVFSGWIGEEVTSGLGTQIAANRGYGKGVVRKLSVKVSFRL